MTKEEWLEQVARKVMTAGSGEIRSMMFAVINSDGSIETSYSNESWSDKLIFAGTIQQDAFYQSLEENEEEDEL